MSLARLVYYSAVIGGWAAFVGWLIAEILILRHGDARNDSLYVALSCGIVGAAIGVGLNLVGGLSNGQWKQLVKRAGPGLVAGGIGGILGGAAGNLLVSHNLPRAIGFILLGLAVGVADAVFERSRSRIRNGLIGGGLGGLIGGVLFDPISAMFASGTGMSSRATAFVVLGVCIGAFVGLAQVILKEAWLTVLDGYRPGRQLILSQDVTMLGRADHLSLPFLGTGNVDVSAEHVRISRAPGGGFAVEDNGSKLGTLVNHQPLRARQELRDGDVIKFGVNFVRFNQSKNDGRGAVQHAAVPLANTAPPPPPPPPPPQPPKPAAPAVKQVVPTPIPTGTAANTNFAPNAPAAGPARVASVTSPKLPPPPPPPPPRKT